MFHTPRRQRQHLPREVRGKERGDSARVIVCGQNFHHVEGDEVETRQYAQERLRLRAGEAARFGRAGAGSERGVTEVNVEI